MSFYGSGFANPQHAANVLRAALQSDSAGQGAGLIGTKGGDTVQAEIDAANTAIAAANAERAATQKVLPSTIQFADYAALRAYARKSGIYTVTVYGADIAGQFHADTADTASTDNGGTVIVAADGTRWKREYTIPTTGFFQSDLTKLKAAIPSGTVIVNTACTLTADSWQGDYTAIFTNNGSLTVAAGVAAKLGVEIIAPARQLFTLNGTLDCSHMPGFANPYWWGGSDLGAAINRAFTSLKRELRLPSIDPNTGGYSVISTPVQMIRAAHLVQDSLYEPITLETGNTRAAFEFVSIQNAQLDLRIRGSATNTPDLAFILARNANGDECGYNTFNVNVDGQFAHGVVYSIGSELDDWTGSQLVFQGQGDSSAPATNSTFITSNTNFLGLASYTAINGNTGLVSNTGLRINPKLIQYDIVTGAGHLLWIRDNTEDVEFSPLYAHYNGTDHVFVFECFNSDIVNLRIAIQSRLETQAGNPATNSVRLCTVQANNNGHVVDGLLFDGQYFLGNAPNATPPDAIVTGTGANVKRMVIPASFHFGNGQVPGTLFANDGGGPTIGADIRHSQGANVNVNSQQVQDSTIHLSGVILNPAATSPWLRSSILTSQVTSFGP